MTQQVMQLSGGKPDLFTGQWAGDYARDISDKPGKKCMATFAEGAGYGGLELACWGDHFEVDKAVADDGERYCEAVRAWHERHFNRPVGAISTHLVGQLLLDDWDERHKDIVPERVWGDGPGPDGYKRVQKELIDTIKAAAGIGAKCVNLFTGSSIWPKVYDFPPGQESLYRDGFELAAERLGPVLDTAESFEIKLGLEVHPTEIAFDFESTRLLFDAIDKNGKRPHWGINLDPSHLLWQGNDPDEFVFEWPDRIHNVHAKDVKLRSGSRTGVLGSHLPFGHPKRFWNFVSPGHGHVDFGGLARALMSANYTGRIAVEWEDSLMDCEHGATEAAELITRMMCFPRSDKRFDDAFGES